MLERHSWRATVASMAAFSSAWRPPGFTAARPAPRAIRCAATFASSSCRPRPKRAGLRPCLRCRPLSEPTANIQDLCHYIEEHCGEHVDLAARAGLSRFHRQRTFKSAVGLTPKQYLEAYRVGELKKELRRAKDVTEAVYGVGFGSYSRVYERADTLLGMTPKQYRQGREGIVITHAAVDSAVGLMMLAATIRGLCFVQFGESEERLLDALRREYPAATLETRRRTDSGPLRAMDRRSDGPSGRPQPGARPSPGYSSCSLSDAGLGLPADVPLRRSEVLRRSRRGDRQAHRHTRRRPRVRQQPGCPGDPLPSRHSRHGRTGRIPLGSGTQTGATRSRALTFSTAGSSFDDEVCPCPC